MKSKTIMFASIFVTVFVLIIGVGIVSAMNAKNSIIQVPTEIPAEVQQQIIDREAAYNDLITQANQRIETLNNQVVELQKNNGNVSVQPAISIDKAVQIALKSAGEKESIQKLPELVDYQGKMAFEVSLQNGIIYIDSETGEVLFSSVKTQITSQEAGEIAGKYLGGMNPKYAVIKLVNLNGVDIYRVTFTGDKDYIVFIDLTGNVIKAQILEYTGGGGGGSSSSGSSGEDHDDESEDGHESGDDD